MDKWQLLHSFNRLAAQGKVAPLACPDCDYTLLPRLAVDDNPMLWCPIDDHTFEPGLDFWQNVRAVVSEHVLE